MTRFQRSGIIRLTDEHRKARHTMASGWISKKQRKLIAERDNLVCCYCGKQCIPYTKEDWKLRPLDVYTLDHIVSQWEIAQTCESDAHFRHARRDPRNLVTVCNGCNSSKKHTELYIWINRKGFDYGKIIAEIGRRIQKPLA